MRKKSGKEKSGGKSPDHERVFIYQGGRETISKTTSKSREPRKQRTGKQAKLQDQVPSVGGEVVATDATGNIFSMDREQTWTTDK